MRRFLIQTFGCQMNVHDSQRIEEVLIAQGYAATDSPEMADLIVFNTCSIREKADHKLRSAVGRFRDLKERKTHLVLAVAGCMAQQRGEALLDEVDLVDVVIGPDNIAELPDLVRHVEQGGAPIVRTVFDLEAPSFLTASTQARANHAAVSAYVTVMKGCDERCTYCIVPYTRGAERYRSSSEILAEIKTLCGQGVREITLLGQTVNSWREPRDPPGESRFPELLGRIASDVPELLRLRYTSPHPRHVTPALVAAHARLDVLAAHVHLPVQSGSDRVLRKMLRRYRRQDYLERAWALQRARPMFTLSTDIIVGFPGETEDDFEATLSLVREAGFVSVFGFKYSPRPHTPALRLGDDVPEAIKSERLARLFEAADAQQSLHLQSLLGSTQQVLCEGPSKNDPGRLTGRSGRNEIVHVAADPVLDLTGQLVPVQIVEANKRSLVGVPLHAWQPSAASLRQRKSVVRLPLMTGG
jgi:tRNA-2-methylthio-N6-dimethylallyladenosine synthase